jgi:hypothetical protein
MGILPMRRTGVPPVHAMRTLHGEANYHRDSDDRILDATIPTLRRVQGDYRGARQAFPRRKTVDPTPFRLTRNDGIDPSRVVRHRADHIENPAIVIDHNQIE